MTSFDELPKTYATVRFAGDQLDPAHISALLPVAPKRAHRKGEIFYAGPHAGRRGTVGFSFMRATRGRSVPLARSPAARAAV